MSQGCTAAAAAAAVCLGSSATLAASSGEARVLQYFLPLRSSDVDGHWAQEIMGLLPPAFRRREPVSAPRPLLELGEDRPIGESWEGLR